MSVLFSENLTFKFCLFSKQFLSLYFLIDRHEPLTGSITSGRCTKPGEYGAEQKAKATQAFGQAVVCKTWLSKTPNLPGEKGDAMLQKQPWCQGLYSVFSGWRVCVSRWRILPFFFFDIPLALISLSSVFLLAEDARNIRMCHRPRERATFLMIFPLRWHHIRKNWKESSISSFFFPVKGIHWGLLLTHQLITILSSLQLISQCCLFCPFMVRFKIF